MWTYEVYSKTIPEGIKFLGSHAECMEYIKKNMSKGYGLRYTDRLPSDVCSHSCLNEPKPAHKCPYKAEINDNYELCNCCDTCTSNCSDDI